MVSTLGTPGDLDEVTFLPHTRALISAKWDSFADYLLRICIALDAFVQACTHFGHIGVTISSRIGTAAAHDHKWGIVGWWLLDHTWPFGKDPITGESHCKSAIENDILRAKAAIVELEDPVVQAYLKNLP